MLRQLAKRILPKALRRPLLAWWRRPRRARWGGLRRLEPVGRVFGFDRGQPIDRYYIEAFLEGREADIRGHVLEVGDPGYTRRFGGDRVTQSTVLHAAPGNQRATLVGDLATGEGIPQDAFDCTILTQTLHVIYDIKAAVATSHRALRPEGVLLATFPGISQISRYDMDRWGDYWRLTSMSARRLFEDVFGPGNVEVEAHGNVLAATAFLQGLAVEDLRRDELDHRDPDYEVLVTVRAVRADSEPAPRAGEA